MKQFCIILKMKELYLIKAFYKDLLKALYGSIKQFLRLYKGFGHPQYVISAFFDAPIYVLFRLIRKKGQFLVLKKSEALLNYFTNNMITTTRKDYIVNFYPEYMRYTVVSISILPPPWKTEGRHIFGRQCSYKVLMLYRKA